MSNKYLNLDYLFKEVYYKIYRCYGLDDSDFAESIIWNLSVLAIGPVLDLT